MLKKYIIALTNLYGVVSAEKVASIYNLQNDDQIEVNAIKKWLVEPPKELEENFVYVEPEGFVHEAMYYSSPSITELFDQHKNIPTYIPVKEELLNYADQYYFEKNEAYNHLYEYLLEKYFQNNPAKAEELATEVHDNLNVNSTDIQDSLDWLVQLGVPIKNDKQRTELFKLIAELSMNTRTWNDNGFTILELNKVLKEKRKPAKELTLLEKYIVALTKVYGRVSKERVAEIYNLQNEEQVTIKEIEKYLNNPPKHLEDHFIYIFRNHFVEEQYFVFEEEYDLLIAGQKGKPYFIPEKEEILLYAAGNYTHYPKEYHKLEEYLRKKVYNNDVTRAENMADEIFFSMAMGESLNEVLRAFDQEGYVFESEKQVKEIMNLVIRLSNNIRLQVNNGFTPNELSKMSQETQQTVTIGRNDPCHCGSGKKYKKCCLKKDRLNALRMND